MRWDERHYDNDIVYKSGVNIVLNEKKKGGGNGNVWSGITVALHEISWKEMLKKGLDLRWCYMKGNDNAWLKLRWHYMTCKMRGNHNAWSRIAMAWQN